MEKYWIDLTEGPEEEGSDEEISLQELEDDFAPGGVEDPVSSEAEKDDFFGSPEQRPARTRAGGRGLNREERVRQLRRRIGIAAGAAALAILALILLPKLPKRDREAPVFTSVRDMEVTVGETALYRNQVTVEDGSGEVDLAVDASGVNLNVPGVYEVIYTATDAAGNRATATAKVTVKEKPAIAADETTQQERLNAKVDAILDEIFWDDMTQREKAWEIFAYIQEHFYYVAAPDTEDEVEAALAGFETGSGDCSIFRAVAKAMLTRAGVKNMDIDRIPDEEEKHSWNLVDVEDGHGWYHFDTCPRSTGVQVFLWTDEEVMAYSPKDNNCYNYDRTKYPEIP